MGIFTRFTLRSLARNRTRTIVSIAGIALSCALVCAIFTSAATMWDGLLSRTLADEGSWQVQVDDLSASGAAALADAEHVTASSALEHYGAAALSAEDAGQLGPALEVDSYPDAAGGVVVPPEPTEGSVPASSNEILLPSYLKGEALAGGASPLDAAGTASAARSDGPLQVGSTIELALGRRVPDAGSEGADEPISPNGGFRYSEDGEAVEHLEDVAAPRTFTVSGFYDPVDWSSSHGCIAFTVADGGIAPVATTLYATTDLASWDELSAFAEAAPAGGADLVARGWSQTEASLHTALLRYEGIVDDGRGIWGTLASIAGVLAGVVVLASISLIYNAFAISVAERTRQFGLLASLGASRRQLRRTVFTEAALLALVAIPAGIALGLAGTWVVFRLTGSGLEVILQGDMTSGITVSPVVIALSAAVSALTIALSTLLPAWRAGRVSAIDALRQTRDVRLTRRERARRRRAARRGDPAAARDPFQPSLADRARLRLEGVPGFLAHRNLTRARGKGRVAVASLAVSVALLVIAGSFGRYMESLAGVVSGTGTADLMVTVASRRPGDASVPAYVDALDVAASALAQADGAEPRGWYTAISSYARIPSDLLSADGRAANPAAADGSSYPLLEVVLVDDASWRDYLRELGLDEEDYTDPARPRAVAYNETLDRSGGMYDYGDLFAQTGSIELIAQVAPRADETFYGIDAAGTEPQALYFHTDDVEDAAQDVRVPLSEVLLSSVELPVGALATQEPSCVPDVASSGSPVVFLPVSALPALAADVDESLIAETDYALAHPFSLRGFAGSYDQLVSFFFNAEDPAATAEALEEAAADAFMGSDALKLGDVANLAEAFQQNRMMTATIQTFTTCFAAICGLIAVANVFNTLSTSIILRKSEFAVLKSIGMGDRTFRRMIARECASYAVRGLGAGLVIAAFVSFLLYRAMEVSFTGVAFALPAAWVAAAVGGVLAVLGLSVVYALMRCRAASVVEALREDAI